MNWLVGLGILLMAALLLWAFSALFISMLAGLAVSAAAIVWFSLLIRGSRCPAAGPLRPVLSAVRSRGSAGMYRRTGHTDSSAR